MQEEKALAAAESGAQEEWDEEDDYDDEEDDADIDAEALEIARRLGEQLWADISKVSAEQTVAGAPALAVSIDGQIPLSETAVGSIHNVSPHTTRKEEAAIGTMKAILGLIENDPQAKSALMSATISNGPNIFDILVQCISVGTISKGTAGPLSQSIVSLAQSTTLFGNLKQSNASSIQLDKGKRKREEEYEDSRYHQYPNPYKRPYVPDLDLQNQVAEAVRVISHSLATSPTQALDPTLVSSIRLQLHQIFLFSVTSAPAAGPNVYALQEIGGLIQVIGVISGIQIGHSSTHSQGFVQSADIGTAVYPCLIPGCHRIFSRLYSLRAHQRSHATHRPYRCNACPASFARNHDLKRHIKLHDKKAWKCEGCHKIFSRRDAIKRHKTGTKTRGPKSEICLAAEIIEVQLEGEEGEDALREERRAKLWNGIVVNESSGMTSSPQTMYRDGNTVDEGEINPAIIAGIQGHVLSLHPLLQGLVGNALGTPISHPTPMTVDPSTGQATLASVIARAQLQAIPPITSTFSAPRPIPNQTFINNTHVNVSSVDTNAATPPEAPESLQSLPSLSMYGLSDEQAQLLEIAIATAASAAQAQAEAEAALEEQEEEEDYDDDLEDSEMEHDKDEAPP